MKPDFTEINNTCNDLADYMIKNQELMHFERIERFRQYKERFYGNNINNSFAIGAEYGIRLAAAAYDSMDVLILNIFIIGAKLTGGRKTNLN